MFNLFFWSLNILGMGLVLILGLNGKVSGIYAIMAGNALVMFSFLASIVHRARNSKESEPDYWEKKKAQQDNSEKK